MKYPFRIFVGLVFLFTFAACDQGTAPTQAPSSDADGAATSEQTVAFAEDHFVVLFSEEVTAEKVPHAAEELARSYGGEVYTLLQGAVNGAGIVVSSSESFSAMSADPMVSTMEPDGVVRTTTGGIQFNPTWGLDRIDEVYLPLDSLYDYHEDGTGETVYVIDTAAKTNHSDFGGRVTFGASFAPNASPTTTAPCNPHATHVSGTVGSATYGVVKNVDIVSVEALGCGGSGTFSSVINSMNWVAANASTPSVVNMSLGASTTSTSIDNAVSALVADDHVVVVSAGNIGGWDACNSTPAGSPGAFTVGATDRHDNVASFSSLGSCVNIFAPGVDITSTWTGSNTATATISGTSMASPHVAGYAAMLRQMYPWANQATIKSLILATSTNGIVNGIPSSPSGTPNELLEINLCSITITAKQPVESERDYTAAKTTSSSASILESTRLFRDEVMSTSERGKQYTQTYYNHTAEIAYILVTNPKLWEQAHDIMAETNSLLGTAVREPVKLDNQLQNQISDLLEAVASEAGDELRSELLRAQEDLYNPEVMQQFNIIL